MLNSISGIPADDSYFYASMRREKFGIRAKTVTLPIEHICIYL